MRDVDESFVEVIFIIVGVIVVWCGVDICKVFGIVGWIYFCEVGNISVSEIFGNSKGDILGCWGIGR